MGSKSLIHCDKLWAHVDCTMPKNIKYPTVVPSARRITKAFANNWTQKSKPRHICLAFHNKVSHRSDNVPTHDLHSLQTDVFPQNATLFVILKENLSLQFLLLIFCYIIVSQALNKLTFQRHRITGTSCVSHQKLILSHNLFNFHRCINVTYE